MKITHGIEYLFVRVAAFLFQILPRRTAIALGEKLGKALNNLWLSRHNIIISNLTIAFGEEITPAKKEELARDIFGNIGKALAETSRLPKTSKEEILRIVSGEGVKSFQEVLDFGKGAVLVGSHFGSWELMGAYANALGIPVDFLIRSQHNKLVDNYMTKLRRSSGARVIHSDKSGGMREIIRALKNNRQIAMISDQHAGSQGIIVNFFGRPVSVPRAPATLAVRTGAPIITGHIYRNPDNTHQCIFEKPVYPNTDADQNEEIFRLTKLYTECIERAIRKRPELWLWTHRRFKYNPKPDQAEGDYVE